MKEVTSILHTRKCHFTSDGRLEVYDARLANRLNKLFKKFDNGEYQIQKGEEVFFNVPPNDIQSILLRFLIRKRALAE